MKKQIQLLIIDDSLIIVARILSLLTGLKNINQMFYVKSFEEAEKFLQKETPDVVLLDIKLQNKSGIDLLRNIRSNNNEIKVIMVTNEISSHYKELCERMGANYFVDKTNDFEKIPEIIENLC